MSWHLSVRVTTSFQFYTRPLLTRPLRATCGEEMDWAGVRTRLKQYGQEHLLHHLELLDDSEKAALYADVNDVDWKKLSRLWTEARQSLSENGEVKDDRLKPLDSSIVGSTAKDKGTVARWSELGEEAKLGHR